MYFNTVNETQSPQGKSSLLCFGAGFSIEPHSRTPRFNNLEWMQNHSTFSKALWKVKRGYIYTISKILLKPLFSTSSSLRPSCITCLGKVAFTWNLSALFQNSLKIQGAFFPFSTQPSIFPCTTLTLHFPGYRFFHYIFLTLCLNFLLYISFGLTTF